MREAHPLFNSGVWNSAIIVRDLVWIGEQDRLQQIQEATTRVGLQDIKSSLRCPLSPGLELDGCFAGSYQALQNPLPSLFNTTGLRPNLLKAFLCVAFGSLAGQITL